MALQIPPVPPILKPIQHFLKVASEHERRDPVITYWGRLFALQTGLKIDKSNDSLAVLIPIMDWLETAKKSNAGEEAISNEVVAQAHVENYAMRLFNWADNEDRSARFSKNVVKAFYTAGVIFDILETFGELTEEVKEHRKYAKWKAAYIHNCLKNGETPVPGPMGGEEEEEDALAGGGGSSSAEVGPTEPAGFGTHSAPAIPTQGDIYRQPGGSSGAVYPPPGGSSYPPAGGSSYPPAEGSGYPPAAGGSSYPPAGGSSYPPAAEGSSSAYQPSSVPSSGAAPSLNFDQIAKAQKYSKLAYSALNYEDIPTAVNNLQRALRLLTTGVDSN